MGRHDAELQQAVLDRRTGPDPLAPTQDEESRRAAVPALERLVPGFTGRVVTALFGGTYQRGVLGPRVRTVTGDVDPGRLGICDAHDHLFLRTPLLPGRELDDPVSASAELAGLRAAGGRALVQWTPTGLGRRPELLARLSRRHEVHVVAATGLHQAQHYRHDPARLRRAALVARFATELVSGIAGTGVRAGLIKVATRARVDERTRTVFAAAARAHHLTGAPVAVHVDEHTPPAEVVDELCGRGAVPPSCVVLGHLGRQREHRRVLEVARTGAFICLDAPSGPSRSARAQAVDRLSVLLAQLVAAGHGSGLLLGADATTPASRARAGGELGAPHVPALAAELLGGSDPRWVHALLVDNPARAFATTWREPATTCGREDGRCPQGSGGAAASPLPPGVSAARRRPGRAGPAGRGRPGPRR